MFFVTRRIVANALAKRGFRSLTIAVAMAAVVCASILPSAAVAGKIAVLSCRTPGGSPAPIEGWTEGWTTAAFPWAGDSNDCATGGTLSAVVYDAIPQPGSAGPYWEYSPPTNYKIIGGQIWGTFNVPGGVQPYTGAAGIVGPQLLFDGADIIGGDPGGQAGQFEGVYSLTNHTGGKIWVYAFCEPPQATCPTGGSNQSWWAVAYIHSAIIVLSNNASPTGSNFTGPLASSAAVSGTASLTFQAADTDGSGVYTVKATVDGQTTYNATPDNNGGACASLGTFEGAGEFTSSQPCKRSESVTVPVNTSTIADGSHALEVTVTDAAGNSNLVYNGTFTSNNAPTITSAPVISGVAQVGSVLTGTPAVFAARRGLDPLGAVSGQWLRCSGPGTGCSAIAGATSSTYTPVAADAAYAIEYQNSVADAGGHTATAVSAPTLPVAAPTQSGGSCSNGCSSGSGGNGGGGGNGGNGAGGGSGSGTAVTVAVSNPGANLGSVLLGTTAKWKVSLKVSPKRVHRRTTVKLSGKVSTSPRPGEGKLIYLQARSASKRWAGRGHKRHRVNAFGRWITFQAFRARSTGSFTSTYRFKLGGRHTYQFRAVAPAEGQFRNSTGTSSSITVQES